jgi:MFS superfamily sulfate permease-like transporter
MSTIVCPPQQAERSAPAFANTYMRDFIASLVVFLVALPLCMGIAIASGVPPALGLATGVIGGMVVGLISGSPMQVSGPAAGLTVIVFEAVREYGLPMLGPILLLAGLLQLVAGRLKLGQWFKAISPAVVYGMLAGIGVLIVAGQFHVMFDEKAKANGLTNLISIPVSLMKGLFPPDGTSHHLAALIGLLTFASILLWNRFRPKALKTIPGSLFGVVLATLACAAFQLPVKYVDIPQNIWSAFSLPQSANLSRLFEPGVVLTVVALAIVASAETLLSAAAVDRMQSGPRANYDKELSAQGIGNMVCGLIGALPMTGVIVRSSANVQAGAKTRLSAIFHGVWLLGLTLMFPSVLRAIPLASLAAVLVFTGIKLVELEHVRKLAHYGKMPIVIYTATICGIVGFDLLTGVMIGLSLSVVNLIWRATHLDIKTYIDRDRRRADVYLEGIATFVRLPQLIKAFDAIDETLVVHLHIQSLTYIDHTTLDQIKLMAERRCDMGGAVEVQWNELTERYHLPRTASFAARQNA